ncbi:MAG: hypothetical protein R8P61_00615 [Bacteroidia bacterium]|nr:hypothetical protein [Bacteroidia bacterium]
MKIRTITHTLLFCSFFFFSSTTLHAQSFFGYQTIGQNTFFFSISWQGKAQLGFGYNFRNFSGSFNDWQAELRFPIDEVYRFKNYQLIAGVYGPVSLKRTFLGAGAHIRWEKNTNAESQSKKLSLAITGIPSYTYAASLTDGAYGSIGARLTYAPVIYAEHSSEGDTQSQFLPIHRLEVGGHLDLHFERTIGLGLNAFTAKEFTAANSIFAKQKDWEWSGDFYLGMTYRLGRN